MEALLNGLILTSPIWLMGIALLFEDRNKK